VQRDNSVQSPHIRRNYAKALNDLVAFCASQSLSRAADGVGAGMKVLVAFHDQRPPLGDSQDGRQVMRNSMIVKAFKSGQKQSSVTCPVLSVDDCTRHGYKRIQGSIENSSLSRCLPNNGGFICFQENHETVAAVAVPQELLQPA
jgi:hypothetical protein